MTRTHCKNCKGVKLEWKLEENCRISGFQFAAACAACGTVYFKDAEVIDEREPLPRDNYGP